MKAVSKVLYSQFKSVCYFKCLQINIYSSVCSASVPCKLCSCIDLNLVHIECRSAMRFFELKLLTVSADRINLPGESTIIVRATFNFGNTSGFTGT